MQPAALDGREEGSVRKMRQRHGRVVSRLFVGVVLAVVLLAASTGSAGAKNIKHPKNNTCTGSADNFPTELGTLSGTYSGHVKIWCLRRRRRPDDDQREPDHRER